MSSQIDIYTNLLLKLSKKALALDELPISAIIVNPVTKKVISACINQSKKNSILLYKYDFCQLSMLITFF